MSRPLVHRHKGLARLALYLVPVVLAGVAFVVLDRQTDESAPASPWSQIDWLEHEAVRVLQAYLQIDTTHETGSEIEAAELLARLLRDAGVDEIHLERLGPRNANLWATLEGVDPRPLVLHHHMDVEPIDEPELWRTPPFGGAIESPYIIGRGVFDMKSIGVAQLMAFLSLAREQVPLRRSLMFLATGDEEIDSWLGTRRLLRLHPEWSGDEGLWAVLTEGGAVEALELEDIKYWGTEFAQKRYVDLWICDADRQRLEDLADELRTVRSERAVTPTLADFLQAYASSRDRAEARELLAEPDVLLDRLRSYPRDVDATVIPRRLDDTMRRSLSVGPVLPAVGGGGYQVHVIVQLFPGDALEDWWPLLLAGRLDGFTYTVEATHPPIHEPSPLDHPVMQTIDRQLEARFPFATHGPIFVPYIATDARYFRSYGITSFGFAPFRFPVSEAMSFMGPNERIALPIFVEGVALYESVVRDLVVASSEGSGE
ncbi:MAG: M20/M25/M40 family metallo-hydrolase [Acidobacteriota bacterium]